MGIESKRPHWAVPGCSSRCDTRINERLQIIEYLFTFVRRMQKLPTVPILVGKTFCNKPYDRHQIIVWFSEGI